MPAELAWTSDLPTRPGLYAWRAGWVDPAGPIDGGLLIVYAPAGTLGVLRACRLDGSHDSPLSANTVAAKEWLGPLPE